MREQLEVRVTHDHGMEIKSQTVESLYLEKAGSAPNPLTEDLDKNSSTLTNESS